MGHALRFFFFFLRAFFSTVLNPASAASGESIQLSSSMFWSCKRGCQVGLVGFGVEFLKMVSETHFYIV